VKIVISDDRFGWIDEERRVFEDDSLMVANCHSEEALAKACADADAVLLNQAPMSAAVIDALSRCRVISRYGIGYDNVDVYAASEAGIWVTNVPAYCTEEVAEHALGLLLACVRAIPEKDRAVRSGLWNINRPIRRMSGRSFGIVGFGETGRALWEKVQGFAFDRILIADPRAEQKLQRARSKEDFCRFKGEAVSFEYLISHADFISFHVPLNEGTRHCVNAESIARMKDGAILINTARGAVFDEAALAAALADGKLAAAGLDVFEHEGPDASRLLASLPNVVLTDHSAYYSAESVSELKTRTALNARDVLEGRIPKTPVNRPLESRAAQRKTGVITA
jgi:D-3-phosphoglycerate dehydrogenase